MSIQSKLAPLGLAAIAALVAGNVLARSARAEEPVVLKLATVAPDGTPWAEQLQRFKARVEAEAPGRVRLKAFLGGTLGDETTTVAETRRGTIAMWGGSTGALGSVVPELQLLELPYLFRTNEEADHILDEVVFEDFRKLLAERGYVLLFWAENGYRSMGTKFGPVHTIADLKGRKMRSQESSVHLETYRALGASPVPISVTEVLSGLQTGVVDGFDNTPLFAFAASWYQGVKHYTVTDHIYQPGVVVISKKVFDGLAPDLQKVLVGNPKAQAVDGRIGVRALTPYLLQNFSAAKVEVHRLTEAEKAEFARLTLPVHQKFIEGEGKAVAPLYKKIQASLAALRKRPPAAAK
jgi:tripartite ATP-independent transporter DctP family solute receptor